MKYTASQIQAIKKSNTNIIVSAGAGSGKTGVLKQRVIDKLEQGIHIDELIILTFTNAAAFEMRSRVNQAVNENPKLYPELKRMKQAVISTFDAFCLSLVKKYHYLLDLPESVTISDRILMMNMEKSVLDDVIKSYYLNHDPVFEDVVIELFQKGDQLIYDAVMNLARKISKEPNPNQLLEEFEKRYFDHETLIRHLEVFGNILRDKIDQADLALKKLIKQTSFYDNEPVNRFIQSLEVILNSLKNAEDMDTLITQILVFEFPRKPSVKNDEALKEIFEDVFPQIKDPLKDVKEILQNLESRNSEDLINNVLKTKKQVLMIKEITKDYLFALEKKKRERQLFSYPDIMDMAIKLLEEHPEIRKA
ncbi:MAG TPA: UvrD-helicase domain-containing protein, partial [Bacillota bacterium]|nr:UvrD-helicase domain-containing protein [Bacillota bacterium]